VSNLKALRSAETELQNTEEQHAEATEVAGPKPDLDDTAEKDDFEASFYKEFQKENHQLQNEANAGVQSPSHP